MRKDMKQARERHLARQARQDALNKLKALSAAGQFDETVAIRAYDASKKSYQNFLAKPFRWETVNTGDQILLLMERKIQVSTFVEKDGYKVFSQKGTYHVSGAKIFGIIIQIGETNNA